MNCYSVTLLIVGTGAVVRVHLYAHDIDDAYNAAKYLYEGDGRYVMQVIGHDGSR